MNRPTHEMIAGTLTVFGEFEASVIRDGQVIAHKRFPNIVTRAALNRLAARALTNAGTPAFVLGVGTVTAAASLDSVNFGEVSRKSAAVSVQSREWFALTATWAGFDDTLTGVALDTVSILDHTSSGQGAPWNLANGLGVTLQASDFLNLTGRIRVGSHDLSHST